MTIYLIAWIIGAAITTAVGMIATQDHEDRKVWIIAGLLLGILGIPVAALLIAFDVDGRREAKKK